MKQQKCWPNKMVWSICIYLFLNCSWKKEKYKDTEEKHYGIFEKGATSYIRQRTREINAIMNASQNLTQIFFPYIYCLICSQEKKHLLKK